MRGGLVAPGPVNVLRPVLPRLRIDVRLGELDAVFEPVTTVLGKKQRLQALGWYYEVIDAAGGNAATEAYTNCVAAWTQRRRGAGGAYADAAALEADLQAQVRTFVVEGGNLPAAGAQVRIQLPGTLTYNNRPELGAGGAADGAALPSHRFNDEGALWTGNPALGRIPIVATIEEELGGTWVRSANRWVHFQLIPPYHDAPADELSAVNALRNQSEQAAGPPPVASNVVPNVGPRPFLTTAMQHSDAPADPQRYNAHTSRGGKRGLPILGNLLDVLPAPAFPGMSAPEASARPHAVRARTNAQGQAGVLFLPSRMGGDRWRLRIFVDPIGMLGSDGTGASAVVHETGRFEVWKHVLWSRYLQKPLPVYPAIGTALGIQARLALLGYDVGALDNLFGPRSRAALRAFQSNHSPPATGDMNHAGTQAALNTATNNYITRCGQNLGAIAAATVRAQFEQMYCVLDNSDAAATDMTEAEFQAAVRWARAQAHANQAAYGLSQQYNLVAMLEDNFQTPHLFEIRHPLHYNRTRGAGVPQASSANNFRRYWQDAEGAIYGSGGLLDLFLRYVNGNASSANPPTANLTRHSTPGFTVVRPLSASRMMFPPNEAGQVQIPANLGSARASGMGLSERGCYVFYGTNYYNNWPYQGDGFTRNSTHEIGHVLYLRHHRTQAGGLHASASFREDHDDTDRCLMGYLYCEGEFCGKCHLKIRGWDISQLPV